MATRPSRKAARADQLAAKDDYSGEGVGRRITDAVSQLVRLPSPGVLATTA
jgi:hypothetical protein